MTKFNTIPDNETNLYRNNQPVAISCEYIGGEAIILKNGWMNGYFLSYLSLHILISITCHLFSKYNCTPILVNLNIVYPSKQRVHVSSLLVWKAFEQVILAT